MKHVRTKVFLMLIMAMNVQISVGQTYQEGVPYQMEQIYEQMEVALQDLPAGVRRVAVYKMNYSALRFSEQEIDFIRAQMESAFREFAGLTVLSPPELEPNDKMKIMGNDSSLQILNIQGRSLADISPELLTNITQKYGVQGLVELGIQRRYPEGLIVTVRMMNPNSREIVWAKNFIANPFELEEDIDNGQTFVISLGAGNRQGSSLFRSDTSFVNQDTTLNELVVDFNGSFTYRQSLNADNSAYIGFTGGISLLRAGVSGNDFELTLFEIGTTYYQALTPKIEAINDYRMMFYTNANVQFPINNTKGEMFSIKPGILLNLSRNLGLSFYTNIVLSGETLTLESNDEITYNKLGYGLHAVLRF